jgi:hypothetical protein
MTRTKPRKRIVSTQKPAHQQELQLSILPGEPKTVRGVKLKHVSAFTMLVSVLCLCAFLVGRVGEPPAKAPGHEEKVRRGQAAESGVFLARQRAAESSRLRARLRISS